MSESKCLENCKSIYVFLSIFDIIQYSQINCIFKSSRNPQMILEKLHNSESVEQILNIRRQIYQKWKLLVEQRKFDAINHRQVNQQKDFVIQQLNNHENQDILDQLDELSFYQQRYLLLGKFLSDWNEKKTKSIPIQIKDINKIVEEFSTNYDPNREDNEFNGNLPQQKKQIRKTQSIEISDQKSAVTEKPKKMQNAGVGSAIFQFFQKKQKAVKNVGFKDLIEKRGNISTSSKAFAKKVNKIGHDVEIKKLLQENKRLHNEIDKRTKEDSQLNEFEKNVLREQKQRYMKRIQQLQQQVEQLARNNYKLQEIQKSRDKTKKTTTFFQEESAQNSKQELLPYYIPTRPNNLQLLTQKNKIMKSEKEQKQKILINLVNKIPPIQRKEQYSFDDEDAYNYKTKFGPDNNNILTLLQDIDEKPVIQNFTLGKSLKNKASEKNIKKDTVQKKLFVAGEQKSENRIEKSCRNDSIEISRFSSFSMAPTAYNASSLFLNASKNDIAIDSQTSTRNKVAFFKKSLIIVRDDDFEIAFKKSDIDSNLSKIRIIFYVQNKTEAVQTVNIEYDYEINYYNFRVTDKIYNVLPNQQERQVLEITLRENCSDLNSVADMHILIGNKRYDLWVPLCFICWTNDPLIDTGQYGFMTIQPDRQFYSYQSTSKILPVSKKTMKSLDETQANIFGRSRFGNHQIKLCWWQKQLTIDANYKILDFLGFIMHHFK